MTGKFLARKGKTDRDPILDLLNALTLGMSPDPTVHDRLEYVDMVERSDPEPERLNFEPDTVVEAIVEVEHKELP